MNKYYLSYRGNGYGPFDSFESAMMEVNRLGKLYGYRIYYGVIETKNKRIVKADIINEWDELGRIR